MAFINKYFSALALIFLSLGMASQSHAHIMIAQHGTLNVIDNGVFMILSLPVSAFDNIDDDKDGKLSPTEFNTHRSTIGKSIIKNITLTDEKGQRPLIDIMLSPVTPHDSPNAPSTQLVVMGRFTLENVKQVPDYQALRYQVKLFSKDPDEQPLTVTATRKIDKQKHTFELVPKQSSVILFSGLQATK
mgnify:CR=1 FL=1|tara:strand:- start:6186 stop:6749 length:564 start_codon:yes stop_codon:yes gene_type:complete